MLGQISFMYSIPKKSEARAHGPTSVLKLQKSVFLEVLKNYKNDF